MNDSDGLGDHGEATATRDGGGAKEPEDCTDDVQTEERGGARGKEQPGEAVRVEGLSVADDTEVRGD